MTVATTYSVAGMKCGGCASKVRAQLEKLDGFESVDIDPKAGDVRVVSEPPLTEDAVRAAVQAAGFRFEGVRA